MITRTWGLEAGWFDGCFCHDDILTSVSTGYKRRLAMIDASGSAKCPWKGKRLVGLALGHAATMRDRVMAASSPRCTEALLATTAAISGRIVVIDQQSKDKWTAEVLPKFNYALLIPWKIAGGFGAYCGYSLQNAKACIDDCFKQYADVKDVTQHSFVSTDILGGGGTTEQLVAFKSNPYSDLREYPLAFVELQERAFCGNSERHTEREHVLVKVAATRGLRFSKPAYCCARKRRLQLQNMLDIPEQRDWVLDNWSSRTIYHDLLGHRHSKTEVNSMSTAARHAKVYGYDLKTVFADTSADQKCVLALTAARSVVQEGANLQLNTSENLIVNFLKNHFIVGYVFSVPRLVFAAALQPVSREFSEIVYEGRFLDAMLDKSLDDVDVSADDRAFFEVVDPRPENKFQIRTSQIARSTTKVQVKKLDVLGARADAFVLSTHGDHHALDLLNWCPPDYFDELMSSLLVYVAAADEPPCS